MKWEAQTCMMVLLYTVIVIVKVMDASPWSYWNITSVICWLNYSGLWGFIHTHDPLILYDVCRLQIGLFSIKSQDPLIQYGVWRLRSVNGLCVDLDLWSFDPIWRLSSNGNSILVLTIICTFYFHRAYQIWSWPVCY